MTPLHDMREHGDGWHVCTRCGRAVLASGATAVVQVQGDEACHPYERPEHVAREGRRLRVQRRREEEDLN